MTDIVEGLRAMPAPSSHSTHWADCWQHHSLCAIHVAADEIERLRAVLRDTAEERDYWQRLANQ